MFKIGGIVVEMKREFIFFSVLLTTLLVSACSNVEPAHPEEPLEAYLSAWSSQSFAVMLEQMTEESLDQINNFDWEFSERYEKVYTDLEVESIDISFEARDYAEEEIDLEELQEVDYPISIEMDTMVGSLNYESTVEIKKQMSEDENEEEFEEWVINWDPTHLMIGMQDAHDQIALTFENAKRGGIFDRHGEPLALNGDVYQGGINPEATDNVDDAAAAFAEVMGINGETAIEKANQFPDNPSWFAPIQKLSLTDDRIDDLREIPGVQLQVEEGREYRYSDITGHVIGYIGPITAEELEEREGEGYDTTSEIGKYGIEAYFEEELRGKDRGIILSILTEDEETRDIIKQTDPVDGEDIHLTLDIEMQMKMAELLGEDSGSGVVIDPISGETLVLASEPAIDSSLRYLGLSDPREEDMDDSSILYESRFQNTYSPGSVFKPFTAIAGIEEGTLDPAEKIRIEGTQWGPDDSSWGGHQVTRVNASESDVDLEIAMKLSDNIYFAQQALALGDEKMEEWAVEFGFGEAFSFDFPLYQSSISNEGLDRDTLLADTGYGQGEVQVSPVHMNAMYSIFLNEGKMVQPTLLVDGDRAPVYDEVAAPETADVILDSLIQVVGESNGTAYRTEPGHTRSLAGKTGTAELKKEQTEEDGEQIGWYVSFDYEDRDLLTTIMIQNAEDKGGSGYAVNLANEFWSMIE